MQGHGVHQRWARRTCGASAYGTVTAPTAKSVYLKALKENLAYVQKLKDSIQKHQDAIAKLRLHVEVVSKEIGALEWNLETIELRRKGEELMAKTKR